MLDYSQLCIVCPTHLPISHWQPSAPLTQFSCAILMQYRIVVNVRTRRALTWTFMCCVIYITFLNPIFLIYCFQLYWDIIEVYCVKVRVPGGENSFGRKRSLWNSILEVNWLFHWTTLLSQLRAKLWKPAERAGGGGEGPEPLGLPGLISAQSVYGGKVGGC